MGAVLSEVTLLGGKYRAALIASVLSTKNVDAGGKGVNIYVSVQQYPIDRHFLHSCLPLVIMKEMMRIEALSL